MSTLDENVALGRAARDLPDGFAIQERVTISKRNVSDVSHVLFTCSPASGHLSRRIGNVTDLGNLRFHAFDDAPFGAVRALEAVGWVEE